MARAIRSLGTAAAASLAAGLSACGTSHPSTTTAPGRTRTGATLAQQVLSEQLALLHRALPAGGRQIGTASDALTCADNATRAGRTGRAVSPSFVYKRMEVRAGTYVFADARAARRALPAFSAEAHQGCQARFLVAGLRMRYRTGSTRVRTGALAGVGQGANTTEITVPTRYKGRRLTWNLDATAVKQGRLIEILETLAGASTARYNQALAAAFAKIAKVEQ